MNTQQICDEYGLDPDTTLFLPEQFDDCLAGIDHMNECVVYYSDKVIECLMEVDGMDFETASEHFSYNIQGSLGEGFPTYIESLGGIEE